MKTVLAKLSPRQAGLWIIIVLLLSVNGWLLFQHFHRTRTHAATLSNHTKSAKLAYDQDHVPFQGTLIAKVSGSVDEQSKDFQAATDWQAYWSFDCSNASDGAGNFNLTVHNSKTKKNTGKPVSEYGASGYGDAHFTATGKLYIDVHATAGCTWKVSIKTLPKTSI
jgi:hypothetical protein